MGTPRIGVRRKLLTAFAGFLREGGLAEGTVDAEREESSLEGVGKNAKRRGPSACWLL